MCKHVKVRNECYDNLPVIALISENAGVEAIASAEYTIYVLMTRTTDHAGKSNAHSLYTISVKRK
jgi:hypothetical protein